MKDKPTSNQVNKNPDMNLNPTGKGGFGDNPQNRSDGRWNKEGSISYNYNKLMRMTPEDFETFEPTTYAEKIAKQRVKDAVSSLNDAKEITDRTEGKAPQFIENSGEQKITVETRKSSK
jgi:hypothetical protein